MQRISDALYLKLGKEAKKFDATKLNDRDLKRKLKQISEIGASALPKDKLEEYNKITTKMAKIYSTAKVPDYKDRSKKLSLDPGITEALAKSTDPRELEYYWTEWRKATGREMRDLYIRYVELANEAARYEEQTAWLGQFCKKHNMVFIPGLTDSLMEQTGRLILMNPTPLWRRWMKHGVG